MNKTTLENKGYADLWGPLSVLIKKLSEVVEL